MSFCCSYSARIKLGILEPSIMFHRFTSQANPPLRFALAVQSGLISRVEELRLW
jgi:hypothetical protein